MLRYLPLLAVTILAAGVALMNGGGSFVQAANTGKVTGGGSIPCGQFVPTTCAEMTIASASNSASVGGDATFGFVAQFDSNGNPTGNLVYHDHALGVDIKATAITLLVLQCDLDHSAEIRGNATVNGVSENFDAEAVDNGEPGSAPGTGPDFFSISTGTTSTTYQAFGELIGGNIQCQQE